MPSLDLFWATFALGCVFGVAARAGNFCLLRGLRQTLVRPGPSDWGEEQAPQGAPALQAFALALAVALVGTQVLAMLGEISLSQVLVVRPRFSPLGALTGGLMFGVGMALAHSCGARALVLPSEWYENAPMSVLEAFASGKPVVGADIGGIPEMITPEIGWVFPSGDVDALAGVLADVFARSDADIAEMGRKARVHCATHFNRTRYIEGIETVYRELGVKF